MKTLTKTLLITASALAVCGAVLITTGSVLGGSIVNALNNLPIRIETRSEVRTVPDRSNGGNSRGNGGNSRSGGSSERGNNGGDSRSYGNGGYGSDIDEFYREFFGDDFDIFGDFFGDGYGNGYDGGNGGGGRSNLEYF